MAEQSVCVGGGGGGEGECPQFRSQMHFYYINRGAHIYLTRAAISPAPPLYYYSSYFQ